MNKTIKKLERRLTDEERAKLLVEILKKEEYSQKDVTRLLIRAKNPLQILVKALDILVKEMDEQVTFWKLYAMIKEYDKALTLCLFHLEDVGILEEVEDLIESEIKNLKVSERIKPLLKVYEKLKKIRASNINTNSKGD